MAEKLIVQNHPELKGRLNWNYTISRDLLFNFLNNNVYNTKETLILKAPSKYRNEILLISKIVGIFFIHEYHDYENEEVIYEL